MLLRKWRPSSHHAFVDGELLQELQACRMSNGMGGKSRFPLPPSSSAFPGVMRQQGIFAVGVHLPPTKRTRTFQVLDARQLLDCSLQLEATVCGFETPVHLRL